MKIEKGDSIKINLPVSEFRNIPKGKIISANIIERYDGKTAVLSFSGKKIAAEFAKGIPLNNRLSLVYESKSGDTLFFRILYQDKAKELKENLFDYTVFNYNIFKNNILKDIGHALSRQSIFALNLYLLKEIEENRKRENKIPDFIKKYLLKNPDAAKVLSLFFMLDSLPFDKASVAVLFRLLYPKHGVDAFESDVKSAIEDLMQKLSDELKSNPEAQKIIDNIISCILIKKDYDVVHGELYHEDFNELKYIATKDAVIFSFSLSYLGNIDVLIKREHDNFCILFFCESDKALNTLRDEDDQLKAELERATNSSVSVFFYNTKSVLEKTIEINSSMIFNNQLDIKV